MSIREDLKAYLDGELSGTRAAEVKAALDADPELRREAERMRAISNTLKMAAGAEIQPVGLDRTLDALHKGAIGRPVSRWRIGGWVLAGGAAVVVLASLAFPWFAQPKEALLDRGTASARSYEPNIDSVGPEGEPAPPAKAEMKSLAAAPNHAPITARATKSIAPAKGADEVAASDLPRAPLRSPNRAEEKRLAPPVQSGGGGRDSGFSGAVTYGGPAGAAKTAPTVEPNRNMDAMAEAAPQGAGPNPTRVTAMALAKPAPSPARLIVNDGDLGVYVQDVNAAKLKAEGFASASHGYVESSSLEGDSPDRQVANLTLRVPVANYSSVMQKIKALGTVNRDASTGRDVTSDVVDTESKVKTLKAEESQYREIMKKAKSVDDVLSVKDKLTEVREDIDQLQAQATSLRGLAALSTIRVTLSVKPKETAVVVPQAPGWFAGTVGSAATSFADTARAFAVMLIYLLVFLPLWGPVLALSFWGYRASRPQCRY